MAEEDIREVINDFGMAARNAMSTGFDGVEIHGANGYLVDQFSQKSVNERTGEWGGSVENRGRFPLEVISAVVEAIGAERTAIRYSPWSTYQGMAKDSDDELMEQFRYLAKKTAEFKLAYVHLIEARLAGVVDVDIGPHRNLGFFFEAYGRASPVMLAGGYDGESACEAVDMQYKDYEVLVAIGIANSDLLFRLKHDIPLRKYEREHFYTPRSMRGYIGYEFSDEFRQGCGLDALPELRLAHVDTVSVRNGLGHF